FNNSSTYTLGGSGKLSGVTKLDLNSAGSVIITNSGNNDFSGPIKLNPGAGLLVIGNGGTNGSIGSGAITNGSGIVVNKTGTNTFNNNFFDVGVVTNKAGVLVLGGDNS